MRIEHIQQIFAADQLIYFFKWRSSALLGRLFHLTGISGRLREYLCFLGQECLREDWSAGRICVTIEGKSFEESD